MKLKEVNKYINIVFDDYLKTANISIDTIKGKRILEIGPGDNLGVALKFLAFGANHVTCVDKFYIKRNFRKEHFLYLQIRNSLDEPTKILFDNAINLKNGLNFNPKKLTFYYGKGIDEDPFSIKSNYYDMILSRAVLEHVYDIDKAFNFMNKILVEGGLMIHKIDFRDHGLFSNFQMHPLTFLTVPDSIYKLMIKNSGIPNRKLVSYYKKLLANLKYESKILITSVLGCKGELKSYKDNIIKGIDYFDSNVALVKKIREKLNHNYCAMPDKELLISGIFIVAKKPIK